MRHAAAAAIASILSLTAAIAESRPEPPPVYEMKLIFVGEAPVESLFVIGNSGFRTVEALKSFLSRLPAGARLTWNPGCIRFGEEPLLSRPSTKWKNSSASVWNTGSTSCSYRRGDFPSRARRTPASQLGSTAGVSERRLSLDRIAEAASVIDPVFLDSPQFLAEALGLDFPLVVKVETMNPIRSFKARGTEFLTSTLDGPMPLACATAGNFGQGMAWSARKRGLALTVYTAVDANPLKVERMRALGADVRPVGKDFDDAHAAARDFALETGARLVEDGRDREIAEGAGTIGMELLRWSEPFHSIVVPLGDGALLAGIARWVKAHSPATRMIGVCASGAPSMERSLRTGRRCELSRTDTIADGIAVRSPFAEAIEDLTGVVDDVLLVDDEAIVGAIRRAHADLGLVLEPAGAAGLAAVLAHRERFGEQLVATVLTGGNATDEQVRKWIA